MTSQILITGAGVAVAQPAPATGATAVEAAVREVREELARELHDTTAQTLALLLIELETMRRELASSADAAAWIQHLKARTRDALGGVRSAIGALRDEPAELFDLPAHLATALDRLAADGVRCDLVQSGWPARLPHDTAHNLRRVVEEALHNVRRHSGAASVTVTLQVVNRALAITVADDGRGMPEEPSAAGSYGLRGMRERALLLGGRLIVDSAPDHGTTIRVIVPLPR